MEARLDAGRTLDRTVVTIPNAEFSNLLQIENLRGATGSGTIRQSACPYETTPEQIRYILVEVHRMLYAHPNVDSTSARIRFAGFGSPRSIRGIQLVTVTDYADLEIAGD